MENTQSSAQLNLLITIGLAIGFILGMGGSFVKDITTQVILYEISTIGLTVGALLAAAKYARENVDLVASGFLLLAIAEATMSSGAADIYSGGGGASFGAGMALYVPALLLISIPDKLPKLVRLTGVLAAIPFTIAAAKIFLGEDVPSTSLFPSIGYGLLTLTIIGWIWTIRRTNKG